MLPHPSITCEHFSLAKGIIVDALVQEGIPASFLEPRGDRCFCCSCHSERGNAATDTRGGRPYLLAVGWCRVGLAIPRGFMEMHRPDKDWVYSYHGTKIETALRVIKGGLKLLFAGDISLGGKAVPIREGHIPEPFKRVNLFTGLSEDFNPNQIFTSPSIVYSGLPQYAVKFDVEHPLQPGTTLKNLRVAFHVLQRPGSFCIGQQTVGRRTQIDPLIGTKELEYYTREHTGMIISGLLIHLPQVPHTHGIAPISVPATLPDVSSVPSVIAELRSAVTSLELKIPVGRTLGAHACRGLVTLAKTNNAICTLGEGGACELVIDIIRHRVMDMDLLTAAMKAVEVLAENESNRVRLCCAGVCKG